MSEINVFELRKEKMIDLKRRVDEAFANRGEDTQLTYDGSLIEQSQSGNGATTMESYLKSIESSNKIKSALGLGTPPEQITITYMGTKDPNEVWVDNPHDYYDLLYLVIKKALDVAMALMSDERIFQMVEEIVAHEFAHSVPAMAQETIDEILYKVRVADNKVSGGINVQPMLGMQGKADLLLHLDIISGPEDPSPGDIAQLGGINIETIQEMYLKKSTA
jgi:hypothetical protein